MLLIDDFLNEEDYKWVLDNKEELMAQTGGTYKWWDGWWKEPAKNIHHKFIEMVHTKYNPLGVNYGWDLAADKVDREMYPNGVAGIEYWTNNDYRGGDWHVNCDEKVRHNEQKFITPPWAIVYYINAPTEGGEIYISNRKAVDYPNPTPDPANNDLEGYGRVPEDFIAIIKPAPNRITFIDPSYWHRTMPFPQGQDRSTFIHDIWHTRISTADAPTGQISHTDFQNYSTEIRMSRLIGSYEPTE
tara:strand:+ start:618 stop:1349 length:732 start_codon:yes stop_codon:yes gene_type:complete